MSIILSLKKLKLPNEYSEIEDNIVRENGQFEQLYPLKVEKYVPHLWEDEEVVPGVYLRPISSLSSHYDSCFITSLAL